MPIPMSIQVLRARGLTCAARARAVWRSVCWQLATFKVYGTLLYAYVHLNSISDGWSLPSKQMRHSVLDSRFKIGTVSLFRLKLDLSRGCANSGRQRLASSRQTGTHW